MRRLDFVGSACSSSVFLWMKTFFMVLASYKSNEQPLRLRNLYLQESKNQDKWATLKTWEPGSLYVLAFFAMRSMSLAIAVMLL